MQKIKIGYTQGTFDTLHFGHVRLLKNAKKFCDYLIVGVNSDELVQKYKHTDTIIKENERAEIIESIKYVNEVHIVNTLDKVDKFQKFKFDYCFIGSDWKGSDRYNETERELEAFGAKVIYLPYTSQISTTQIKKKLKEK